MRLHCLQHVPFEGLEFIQSWAHENHFICTRTAFYQEGWQLPALEEIDWLVIMGGPMSVYDEDVYSWLADEKQFIKESLEGGKTVLGICLGAQLIADAMGATVRRNAHAEIGWHDVELTENGTSSKLLKGLPEKFKAFHWHGDKFAIPSGAKNLISSEACAHQAFEYDNRVLGLQFHLESSVDSVEMLLQNCSDELVDGRFIQSVPAIRAGAGATGEINRYAGCILDNLKAS